jgi:peptide/nickel transport system ATP-binding protein
MAFLSAKGLSAKYNSSKGPVYAVDDVDFELEDGKSIGIAGESACGKSTLGLSIIRMLSGGKIDGEILFDGESILDIKESDFDEKYRWKKISMVFQGAMNSLDPVFTIKEQFLEILKQHNFDGDTKQVISDAMNSVSLDELVLKKYPHELSGGMKQRVVIAMALLLKPKFVIADEPTTALDVLIQAQIVNLLKNLKKDGMSFMLITHDLAVLSEIADKIGIMYGGHMVEFGSSQEIYKNPKHPYTQGLLESIPTLKGGTPKYIKGIPPSLLDAPTECRFIDRCPLAIDKCKQVPPKFKTKTGYVRCWLYEEEK